MALNTRDAQFLNSESVKKLVNTIKDYNDVKDLALKTSVLYEASLDAQAKVNTEAERAISIEGNLDLLNESIISSDIYKGNKNLVSAINAEVSRAKSAEENVASKASTDLNLFKSDVDAIKTTLESAIASEIDNRTKDTASIRTTYDGRLNGLESALKGYADSQVAAKGTELTNTINITAQGLSERIDAEIQNRSNADTKIWEGIDAFKTSLQSEISLTSNTINTRIDGVQDYFDKKIIDHNSQYSDLNSSVQSHLENENNPHKVNPSQIGAATQADMDVVEEAIRNIEQNVSSNASSIQTINETSLPGIRSSIQDLDSRVETNANDISSLKQDKLDREAEEQAILGNLIIGKNGEGGDLTVQGNLIVNGATITQQQETIQVKDNFIVINSEGETIGSSLAGIAIRTNNESAYGIAYDATNQTISLGVGSVELASGNNSFSFKTGESNPILTRDVSNKIADGNLLSFDRDGNKAVDSGYNKAKLGEMSESLTAHQTSLDEISSKLEGLNSTTIANLQKEDEKLNGIITSNYNELSGLITFNRNELDALIGSKDKLETISEKSNVVDTLQVLDGRLDSIERSTSELSDKKQDKEDSQLATINKSIVPAINEIHSAFTIHKNNVSNPHNVTWDQICNPSTGGSPVFATSGTPLMNGEASLGTNSHVARQDHVHPTDTSRAPENHASPLNTYGVADTTNYGHVRITDYVSEGNIDIANSGTVYTFVTTALNTKIDSLDYSELSLDDGETIKSISQTDGIIKVEKQSISITQDQVQGLNDSIGLVNDYIIQIKKDIFGDEEGESTDGSLSSKIAKNANDIIVEKDRALAVEASLDVKIYNESVSRNSADDELQGQINGLGKTVTALISQQGKIDNFRESYHELIATISDNDIDSTYYTFKFEKIDDGYSPVFVSSWDEGVLYSPEEIA